MREDAGSQARELLRKELGNWWQDERRRWCAYCGIPMRLRKPAAGQPIPPTKSTREHIIPRRDRPEASSSPSLTIPACRGCNAAKNMYSLPEFLQSDYFMERRKHRHGNQWPEERLWQVLALAALDFASGTRVEGSPPVTIARPGPKPRKQAKLTSPLSDRPQPGSVAPPP